MPHEVSVKGTCGGLYLACEENIEVTLRTFSKNHINVIFKEKLESESWRFTRFYGNPFHNNRGES